jgi:hypothetical protein
MEAWAKRKQPEKKVQEVFAQSTEHAANYY